MTDPEPTSPFLLCVKNEGYPASLEIHKVYRSLTDPGAELRGFVRVGDESGEDSLYPADCFVAIELPAAAARVSAEASYHLRSIEIHHAGSPSPGESPPRAPSTSFGPRSGLSPAGEFATTRPYESATRKIAMGRPSCPRCQSLEVVAGDCAGQSPVRGFSLTQNQFLSWFIPARSRFFRWKTGLSFTRRFAACMACGHVWGAVDPSLLRSFVTRYCDGVVPPADDEVDRHRADLASRDMENLPDTAAGREIAAILATLDRLVSSSRTAELPGQFRAMTGATWEAAARVTHDWQYRTRGEKLERLGWNLKPKKRLDDLADPLV